jgi:hypothetical protein
LERLEAARARHPRRRLAWAGRDKEARETIERLKLLDPNFTALTYQAIIDFHTNPTFQAQAARILKGMRLAGVPEE